MGLLQALIGFVRRSSVKVVQAIFGWAVQALFGTPKESERTLLSAAVAVSAIWPFLLVGVAFPKAAALILAFVPLSNRVPTETVRLIWIGVAILAPVGVGIVLARRGDSSAGEPFWKRAARGFPVTAAIGTAFLVAFVTSPVRRLITFARRWEEEHLPLLLENEDYLSVAEQLRVTLFEAGLRVRSGQPPWLLTAPSRVVRGLGGRTLRDRMPENLQFFKSADLELVVQPNGVTLRGERQTAARAHGILSEEATLTPGLQTTDPAAQALEKELKDIWRVWSGDPGHHDGSRVLLGRLEEVSRELDETFLTYEQWQVLYREILQLHRAITGQRQLLEKSEARTMDPIPSPQRRFRSVLGSSLDSVPTATLLSNASRELGELTRKEIELAKAELRADLKEGLAMARSFAIATVAGLCFVNMLFVAAALWLSRFLPSWAAALSVAGLLFVLAGSFAYAGWKQKVRPLEATRKTIKENWQWAKSRIA
jgi:hypothetical protein